MTLSLLLIFKKSLQFCICHFNPIQDGLFQCCSHLLLHLLTDLLTVLLSDFNPAQDGQKASPPLPKICDTYPAMMKLGRVILYPKKIQKLYELRDAHLESLSSAAISIFSPKMSKFCSIKKYRYRLNFNT